MEDNLTKKDRMFSEISNFISEVKSAISPRCKQDTRSTCLAFAGNKNPDINRIEHSGL